MIRGTTTTYKFKLPYPKDEFTWITIKFWQDNNPSELLPITKTKEHCGSLDNPKEICVSLTAEETARFTDKYKAKLQMRALHTVSGVVYGNRAKLITVHPMSDDIINENPILPSESKEGLIVLDGQDLFPNRR
jgi:hypothetical protein